MRKPSTLVALLCSALTAFSAENVDLAVVNKIKTEAFTESKVMDTMFYLTDVYGPRLTNSPNYQAAGDWAVKRLQEYGLTNVHQEKWGPFGNGWANQFYEGHMEAPQYSPLTGVALAWSAGTDGPISAEPVLAVIRTGADVEQFKGKLKGKIVMVSRPSEFPLPTSPEARRYSEADLETEAAAPDPADPRFLPASATGRPVSTFFDYQKLQKTISTLLRNEGAVMILSASRSGDGGTIFAMSGGFYQRDQPLLLPWVGLMPEQYNRIARLLDHKIPVKLSFQVKNEFVDKTDCFNIIGDIQGTGPHKNEIVMLGAHFDSWQVGTGATDNAAGSAVMMEAVRILKTANLPLDRTVRIALWGGEEEGHLGSRAYVKEHFADRATMKITGEHSKLSGYFNLDNGTGKIRGVYLQGNDMMRPIFEAWFEPFKDLGAHTIAIRNTINTDHQSFDGVGLPGFQFIQDPMDYETRTHHSNMDLYDRIQAGDLMQSAAIIASFAYNASNRAELLPRKPLPKAYDGPGY